MVAAAACERSSDGADYNLALRETRGRGVNMENEWARVANLQLRQLGDLAYRRSFYKYNHRASDASFSDLCRDDAVIPVVKNCRLTEPSVLDRRDGEAASPFLNPEIWKKLPENLIETIFPHLPLHSVLRFRAVCKKWHALLHYPAFLQSWNFGPSVKVETPWLIFRGCFRECVAYNPSLDRWSNIPLDFLPSPKVRLVASGGGLLCVRKRDDSLMVLNPFTKSFLHLPSKLCKWKYPIVGMVPEQSSDQTSYRVIVAGNRGVSSPDLTTEVYDSVSKDWTLVGSKPARHQFQTNAVYCNGFLYSAGFSVIMVYDVANEVWSEMPGPPVIHHTSLIMPQICECRGRLLMVEVVSERFVMQRVSIWAATACSGASSKAKWMILDTMPDHLLGEVIAMSNHRFFSFFGSDDLLCLVIARQEILAYTISTRTWRWLPSCPYVQRFAQRFAAFSFHPTLSACE